MKSIEKSAKTYEEAVTAALEELNAAISDVDVLVLEEGSKGLFGLFGSRPTKVRVTLKEEEAEDDLLDLLHDKKPEVKKPAPKAEKKTAPEIRPAANVEPEQTAAPAKVEQSAEEKKPLPEPVRRQATKPVKKEKPAKREVSAEEAAPAAVSVAAGAVAAEVAADAVEEAPKAEKADKPEKAPAPRQRKPRQPKADKVEKAEKAPETKKPLPPKAPVKPLEKPVVTMIPNDQVDAESAPGKVKAFLLELTQLMGVHVEIAVGTDAENNVYAQMAGDTLGVLIGRHGETLDALQYLTSLRLNRGQEGYTRVTLDTENYRAKREDTLIRLANRMANRAVKTGRKVSMEPMNPYERRIIHSALQSNEAVDTHSEGEEPNRHVVITLRK